MLLFFGYPEDLSTSRETLPSHPAAPRLANPPSQSPDRRLETKLLPSLAKLGSATQPNYTVSAVYLPTLLPRHPPSICQPLASQIFICTIMLVALGQAPDYYKGLERLRLD
ncbi:hypothetical protein LY78DRAFT_675029 [Colletotrichum sublineola]|nr:hypothetical protein LY78DRAFT_675029 [Colletotrichum sublineola]